jgi:hypothetical protein
MEGGEKDDKLESGQMKALEDLRALFRRSVRPSVVGFPGGHWGREITPQVN